MKPSICPFLGLKDDPETHHAFPALGNSCQRARPIETISLEHQSTHCLCSNYVRCVVLANNLILPLPIELRVPEPSMKRKYIGVAIPVVLILILVFIGWRQNWYKARSAAPVPTMTEVNPDFVEILSPISTSRIAIPNVLTNPQYTHTLSPGLTPSLIPSLSVPQAPDEYPTVMAEITETTVPLASETICAPPSNWVIYIIQPNDSLYNLGLKFGVTVAELQKGNCMGDSVLLYAGQKLFVPNVPTQTTTVSPTRIPTRSATPTEEIGISTDTPEPIPTETPIPTDTPQPTDTPNPTNTLTPPPLPTDTYTPPPTEAGRKYH